MTDHISVFYTEALEFLALRPDGLYVDATFGAGGHTAGMLAHLPHGRVIAIDADPGAQLRLPPDPRITFVHDNFRNLSAILDNLEVPLVDGVLFDLGVSSMQFDQAQRGFSFQQTAPLDMRMNPHEGRSAYDVLNTASEAELADIFFYYGQERAARKIARVIVKRRETGRLPDTTTEFAALISGLLHKRGQREKIHPATRVFQALRIAVNDELDALKEGLQSAVDRLRSGGRVVAISFHSLEDRIVKTSFREEERLEVLTRRPLSPSEAEIAANPRARSAKLRAAQKKAS